VQEEGRKGRDTTKESFIVIYRYYSSLSISKTKEFNSHQYWQTEEFDIGAELDFFGVQCIWRFALGSHYLLL